MLAPLRFLDLSGYMFTGKAALHDLISEIDGFATPGNRIEFDLIRVKDGLADLAQALEQWSPIRSDAAGRRYLAVVRRMHGGARGWSRLVDPGFSYGQRYPELLPRTEQFLSDISVAEWDMYWPYHLIEMNRFAVLRFKLMRKFFGRSNNLHYRLLSRQRFDGAVKGYLRDVLGAGIDRASCHTVVLNNAFEPFDPLRYTALFDDARAIVVDRDPRDVFVVANTPSVGFNDQVQLYRRIAGATEVGTFIERIRTYRAHTNVQQSERVLRLQFEDLVTNYEQTLARLYAFLGVDASTHVRKLQCFDPAKSKQQVGLWRTYSDQRSINMIAEALIE